jgi:Phage tail assembly chaperone proteins, E, or 41 or 14
MAEETQNTFAPAGGLKFPVTIQLGEAITVAGQKITSITLRSPKGRDWKRWGGEPEGVKRTMGLLCDLSGVEEDVFDELNMEDHARCVSITDAFFARYQPEENGLIKLLMTSPSVSAGLVEMLKTST